MQQYQYQWPQSDSCVQQGAFGEPIVLVIEDSSDAPSPLASILKLAFPNARIMVTDCVHKASDILAMPVDIAVVDLELWAGSGIEMVQQCFRLSPLTRCVITTDHDDDSYLIPALAAGALGYLLKNQPEIVLIQQLRLLAEGIAPLAPSVVRRLVRQFMTQPAPVAASATHADFEDDLLRLSARETQVLRLIAKGMAIMEVARLLEITANTVCSHIKTIYRKRNVSSRAEAALEAKRLGLV